MWYSFYYNTGTGTGQTIYRFTPTDEAIGVLENVGVIDGVLEEQVEIFGYLNEQVEIEGVVEEQEIYGDLEIQVELKGEKICP